MTNYITKKENFQSMYHKLFWLFMAGSLAGVLLEGIFCFFKYGHWETHVVSIWGPFCILYGIGAAGCYAGHIFLRQKKKWLQFTIYCLVGFGIELVCGCLLEFGLHMRAWNYSRHFLNFRGHVSLQMTIVWGLIGIAFSYLVPGIEQIFSKMKSRRWKITCSILTAFMAVNFLLTFASIVRWKDRHFQLPAQNQLEQLIDQKYDDDFMAKRFCEWRFLY